MKVFMIGGTGLIGSEGARELMKRGHSVSALALPPIPTGAQLPEGMEIKFGNYMDMPDDELAKCFRDCQAFVFAAGVDERVVGPPPIYDFFKKYNITPLERLLRIAKKTGVQQAVICGSYFSYFARAWPEMELTKWHPYIRSRVDQEEMVLSYADEDFNVAVLEIPYVFGTQPGRKPVWMFLVDQIRNMKRATLYPAGGTTMVTIKQMGEAIAGAIEKNQGGKSYPIGYYNMTWVELLKIFHKYMGCPDKKIITIPKWLYVLGSKKQMREEKKIGQEGGLHIVKFADIMYSETFIDKSLACDFLGVEEDNVDGAIGDSVKLSMDILDGRAQAIGMRGE